MPKPKYVTVSKDGSEGQVSEESLPTWEKHGWTVVDDGDSEENAEVAPSAHPQPKARSKPAENPDKE